MTPVLRLVRSSGGRVLARRLVAFGSLPLLASLAPVLLLPLIARVGGPQGWVAVLGGQALGNVAAVVVMWGWSIEGQVKVARATSADEQAALYRSSLGSRTRLLVLVALVGAPTAWLTVGREEPAVAVLMFLATALNGLSFTWYATGLGVASYIARFEMVPRLLGVAASIPVLLLLDGLWLYPVMLAVGTGAGVLYFHRHVFGSWWPAARSPSTVAESRNTRAAAAVSITGTLYSAAPIPMAGALALSGVEGLASADRFYRLGTLGLTAFSNALLAWALEPDGDARHRRIPLGVWMHVGAGVVGGLVIALAGQEVSRFLFGAAVGPAADLMIAYGVAFAALATSTALLRLVLVPSARLDLVLYSTVASLVVGLVAIAWWGSADGASGVARGLALSEVVMMLGSVLGARVCARGARPA